MSLQSMAISRMDTETALESPGNDDRPLPPSRADTPEIVSWQADRTSWRQETHTAVTPGRGGYRLGYPHRHFTADVAVTGATEQHVIAIFSDQGVVARPPEGDVVPSPSGE